MNPDNILDLHLFTLAGTPVTVATLVTAFLIMLAAFGLSYMLQRALRRAIPARDTGRMANSEVVGRLLHYAILFVALGVAFDTVGVDLAALFAAGAIFAVGIGFAMQNIAQNFVSGVILLLDRSIQPADILEVEGRVVRVGTIGIRTTIVRTRDDEEMIVPNSVLVQSTVTNFTLNDHQYRLRARVGVIYGSDMRVVMDTLREAAGALAWRNQERDPRILLTEFGDSSVNFEVSVWVNQPWESQTLLSELHQTIWWSLKDVGVTIAFPQLDVHFDKDIGGALTQMAAA